jgi:cysteine-rich repeat protein
MSKGSKRLSAPWVSAALLGAGVVSAGACGGIAENELFNSGAAAGTAGTGGAATTSTSSTPSTSDTSSGQGGDSTSTASSMGPGGSSGTGGTVATTTATTTSTTTSTTTTSTSSGGPACGNGMIDAGEICDGAQLGGQNCTTFGYSNGAGLTCSATCQLDSATCKPTCGDGKVEPTEGCDDGNTKPGDGCDAACKMEPLGGTTCANAIAISVGLGSQDVSGTTVGGGTHTAAGCTSAASDRVYAIKATAAGFLTANLVRSATSFDSTLYLASMCSDNGPTQDVLCNDSHSAAGQPALNGGEVVSVRVTKDQTYFLIVDGPAGANAGTYKLHLDLSLGSDCGDPVPIPLEDGTGMTVLGSTTGINANVQGTCSGGSTPSQVVYAVTRAANGKIDADTVAASTNYNSVLYARTMCSGGNTEIDCSNNAGNAVESITIPTATAGTPVYVWIDGSIQGGGGASGNYGLKFTP